MNKNNWIKYISFALCWILIVINILFLFKKSDIFYTKENSSENLSDVTTYNGNIYTQNIIASENNLNKIKIYFDRNNVSEKQKIKLELINKKNNKVIYEKSINNGDIIGNGYYVLSFPKISNSNKKEYQLVLKYDENIEKKLLPSLVKNENGMIIDKQQHDYNFAYTALYYNESMMYISLGLFSIIFVLVNVFLYFIFKRNMTIEKKYLFLAFIIYSLFLVFMPMFTGHDEYYHWFRSYEVSEGRLLSGIHDEKALSKMPLGVGGAMTAQYQDITYQTTKNALGVQIKNEEQGYHDMSTVAVYSPVQYLPQAIGIRFASIFTNRSLLLAYAGRFFNMLFAILMIYMSIKIIPVGKKMLFSLAFFPILVEGFVTFSPDCITTCTCILFVSYILKLLQEKEITKRDVTILTILGIVIGLCKIVYIPFVFLVLLLPKEKFNDTKNYWKSILVILISSIFANLVWLGISSQYLALYRDGASSIQTKFVIFHMFEYLQIFLDTLFTQVDYYLMTMIGRDLGWGALVVIYPIIVYIMIGLFLLAIITEHKQMKILREKKSIFIMLFISLIIIGLIFTSLFVQWTRPHVLKIDGVQGRYFLPIIPLLGLLCLQLNIKMKTKIDIEKLMTTVLVMVYFIIFAQMFISFI